MRENYYTLYLKRSFLCTLMTVVSLLTCQKAMAGESIDSLYHIYLNAEKSHKIEIVNSLSHELLEKEITDTLYLCSPSTKPDMIDATMHYLMGESYYDQENFDLATKEGKQAQNLILKGKDDKFKSDVLSLVSNAQLRIGDYDEALKALFLTYQVDKGLDNEELISRDFNTLAAIYTALEQPEQGIHYIEKAIALERKLGRQDQLATRLGIASKLYLMNDEPEKAMDAITEAYQLDSQSGRSEKTAVRMIQKAAILEKMQRLDEARSVIMKAMPELEKADDTYSLAVGYNQLGSIEKQLGNIEAATDCYKKALQLSIRCGSPLVEREAERGLWESMRETNPQVALLHLERYTTLSDSLHEEMRAIKLDVMKATTNDIEQEELNKKNQLFNKLLKWGEFALVVMLTLMLGGLFSSWRRGKKTLLLQRQTQDIRSFLFTNITNELQTPLTVVMNAGQELLDGGKNSAEENKRLGEMIVRHGKNMLGLVNQMFDIEKVKSSIGTPELKEGDIVLFVKLLVDNYASVAKQKFINMEFSSPVNSLMVVFAPDYIRKIIHSLIDKAIMFTSRNGTILVKLEPPENGEMRIIVSDTGKGIPVEERKRIFEPFTQSRNGDEGVETAMNLTLVKQLVLALNGTIDVESEIGKGTTFTIVFPVQLVENDVANVNAPADLSIENKGKPNGTTRHKPLAFIVENNEDVAFFAAKHLREDFDLRMATDGREALQNAQEMVPDLIVTNIIMPVLDGKELMRQVRSTPQLSHIPIIAMTADRSEQERMSCIEAGADVVLVKPFNSSELQLVARHLIKQCSVMRERLVKTNNAPTNSNAPTMSKEDKEFINRLVDVIHAQMSKDDINIDHIAAALSLSRKQLRSRVMSLTGLTPVAYILQVRLNYARRMIVSENTSLTIIANKCGFQNLSHFSKAFKQQFGVSPLQFRKYSDDLDNPQPIITR